MSDNNLVIGASGLVGSYLFQTLLSQGASVQGTYHENPLPGLLPLDIADTAAVDLLLEATVPSVIYLPAANPNVEWLEEHPEESRRVNVTAPQRLVDRLKGSTTRLVYYSTDYVFDGTAGPYAEEDATCPLSVYGMQKWEMEQYIRAALPNQYLILRTAVVYGWERNPKNFAQRMINNFRMGNTILRVPSDQYSNPSYAPNIAEASIALADAGETGVFHLCGETVANRYEFALAIAKTFDFPEDGIAPVTTDRLSQKAKRPLNAGMVVEKAKIRLSLPLLGYTTALKLMMESEKPSHA